MSRLARVIHPWRWINRVTLEPNFKVERGLFNTTAAADSSDYLAGLHPVSRLLGQAVIVTVKAHPAVTVVDDSKQTLSS